MGYINIEIGGSFGNTKPHSNIQRQFSALELGHAAALAEAIEFLAELLPLSIDLDHRLQAIHSMPGRGFGVEWDDKMRALVTRASSSVPVGDETSAPLPVKE